MADKDDNNYTVFINPLPILNNTIVKGKVSRFWKKYEILISNCFYVKVSLLLQKLVNH